MAGVEIGAHAGERHRRVIMPLSQRAGAYDFGAMRGRHPMGENETYDFAHAPARAICARGWQESGIWHCHVAVNHGRKRVNGEYPAPLRIHHRGAWPACRHLHPKYRHNAHSTLLSGVLLVFFTKKSRKFCLACALISASIMSCSHACAASSIFPSSAAIARQRRRALRRITA